MQLQGLKRKRKLIDRIILNMGNFLITKNITNACNNLKNINFRVETQREIWKVNIKIN